jgi:hypothetical protein
MDDRITTDLDHALAIKIAFPSNRSGKWFVRRRNTSRFPESPTMLSIKVRTSSKSVSGKSAQSRSSVRIWIWVRPNCSALRALNATILGTRRKSQAALLRRAALYRRRLRVGYRRLVDESRQQDHQIPHWPLGHRISLAKTCFLRIDHTSFLNSW